MQNQYAAVPPRTNIYSERTLLTSADDGFPELARSNLHSSAGVVTRESLGLLPKYPPSGNLQLHIQEAIQNRQGQGYWIPMPDVAEVDAIAQSTASVHQSQCPVLFLTQSDVTQSEDEAIPSDPSATAPTHSRPTTPYPASISRSTSIPCTATATFAAPALCQLSRG